MTHSAGAPVAPFYSAEPKVPHQIPRLTTAFSTVEARRMS